MSYDLMDNVRSAHTAENTCLEMWVLHDARQTYAMDDEMMKLRAQKSSHCPQRNRGTKS